MADEPRPDYIVHGVCPYECCKYGEWTMLEGGALRSAPTQGADSVGSVATGARVHTDSGVMVLSPPGIAVIAAADTSSAAGASGPQAGDTVEVISYTGQKVTRVLWQGQELERNSGLHMIRDPVQRWWVYITDPATLRGGWLQVGGVSAEVVGAPNACSKK